MNGSSLRVRATDSVRLSVALTSVAFLALAAFPAVYAENASMQVATERPNIVMIMTDDLGFSDIGSYGSEIATPNMDRLAKTGVRFTRFANMAKCEPSRSSLLTGLYLSRPDVSGMPVIPERLREAGYYTAMVGKEHFGRWVPKSRYAEHVFDDSFVYWAISTFFPPEGLVAEKFQNNLFRLNGREMPYEEIPVEKQPFYKPDVETDYALKFLDKAASQKKPFFLYIAYHNGHFPLQARQEDIAKYRGKYLVGWDAIRAARFEKQKALGVIPAKAKLSPPESNINKTRPPVDSPAHLYRPWESLSDAERDAMDLEMAVYAAMVDNLDQNIGRLLAKLDEMGVRDNTLILLFSDNGACPYDSNIEGTGPPGGADSFRSLSAPWANVSNTPFRYYKQYGHEGGQRAFLIANWPKVLKPGIDSTPVHIVDMYPTLVELAGAEVSAPAPEGLSLAPVFYGKILEERPILIGGLGDDFRSVQQGDWKIVRLNGGPWELYNLAEDPTELENLADAQPERVVAIERAYQNWVAARK